MGQILALVSGKGGTGKTSLCAGIATCLAAAEFRVLCIDADLGLRNLDISLGMVEFASVSFTSVMDGSCPVEQIPAHPGYPSLFLLTAPVTMQPDEIDAAAFSAMLIRLQDQFDYILIDAPAGLGLGFRLATFHADRILVVTGSDPGSLRDAASVSRLLANRSDDCVRLIVNRVVPKLFSKMSTTVDDLMDATGLPLIGLVPEDVSVTLAAAAGVPLIAFTDHGAAQACRNISLRVRGRMCPLMSI